MSSNRPYWDERREKMDPSDRLHNIFVKIKSMLNYVYPRIPFYKKLYDQHGVHPEDIRSLADFSSGIPVVTKEMLRQSQSEHPPFGDYLGVAPGEVRRIQGTSGTTGQPTLFAISGDDWDQISVAQAMQCWAAGLRPDDTVQIAFPLSLYVGGWGLLGAAEHIGARVLPMAGGSTERQIRLLQTARSTVLCATPSFGLHILEKARSLGVDLRASALRLGFFGGEPGGGVPEIKRQLEAGFGIKAIDFGNVAELHPCSNMECSERTGLHVYQDIAYTEVVNPDNPHQPRPMGERGAVVYTHLWRRSQPMIRYFPGDETVMTDAPCPCGRTYPRLPNGIIGRLDDLLIVRGVKFYPADLENALRSTPGMGTEFRVTISRPASLDEIVVEAEVDDSVAAAGATAMAAFRDAAITRLRADLDLRITVAPRPPGHFPRTDFKARRVIDTRTGTP